MVDAGEMKSHRPRYGACWHVYLGEPRPLSRLLGVPTREGAGGVNESWCFPKGLEELCDVLNQRLESLAIDVLSLAGLVAFEHLLNTFVRVRVGHEPCAHRAL